MPIWASLGPMMPEQYFLNTGTTTNDYHHIKQNGKFQHKFKNAGSVKGKTF